MNFLHQLREKGIIGEIGWNFYNVNGKFIETGFENKIVNLSVSEIRKMKKKVTIAFGKEKIEVLKAFLKTGITNILITDSLTAIGILDKNKF